MGKRSWVKAFFFFFSVTELEQNWEAMDGSQREAEKKHFFINICHRVLQTGQARGCPEDAAVCAVGEWYPAVSRAYACRRSWAASRLEGMKMSFLWFITASSLWVQRIKDGRERRV